jgi:hypothetical protein
MKRTLQGVKARLTFANVVSAIALFAALGGGYAAAFSGGGSLAKARVTGLGADYEKIMDLPGIGPLKAKCEGDVEVTVRIKNQTEDDDSLLTYQERAGSGYVLGSLNPGETTEESFEFGGWVQMYMHSRETDDKRPQIRFDYGVEAGSSLGTCDIASVSVLVLTTEE